MFNEQHLAPLIDLGRVEIREDVPYLQPSCAMISGSQWSATASMSPSGVARLTPILPRQDLDYLQLDIPFLSPPSLRAEIQDMRMPLLSMRRLLLSKPPRHRPANDALRD